MWDSIDRKTQWTRKAVKVQDSMGKPRSHEYLPVDWHLTALCSDISRRAELSWRKSAVAGEKWLSLRIITAMLTLPQLAEDTGRPDHHKIFDAVGLCSYAKMLSLLWFSPITVLTPPPYLHITLSENILSKKFPYSPFTAKYLIVFPQM